MNYRFMRIIVMFDLPTETCEDRKIYRRFRKRLIENGFMMLQKSIYCKMAIDNSKVASIKNKLRKDLPKSGLIQLLVITEKQYSNMDTFVGELNSTVLESDNGIIIIWKFVVKTNYLVLN